jgi:tetratricopeptide (TPR) repeat protein
MSLERSFTRCAIILLGILAMSSASQAQDWKGTGRLEGQVTDESGAPVAGVKVTANLPARGGGTTLTTNKKGRWALAGIASGEWEFDFEAPGYLTQKISIRLPSESTRLPIIKVTLEKGQAAPPPEVLEALDKAEEAYKQGRFAEARQEYDRLLALRPDLAPTIHQQIGFAYIQEKEYAKAVAELDLVLAAEPDNTLVRALAAQAAFEAKMPEKGKELIAGLDLSKITNPDVLFNLGAGFFNFGAMDQAIDYFTRALSVDPTYVDAYYRRALTYLGQGKNEEAKADFQKVVELAPEGEMASMSRKALEQIK